MTKHADRSCIVDLKTFDLIAIVCLLAIAIGFQSDLWAQQVPSDPTSSHIFPAGGKRGTKVEVRVGGECLPPLTRFRIFGEGLNAPELLGPKAESRGQPSPRRRPGEVHIYYPKEWQHSIDIAADAPLGMSIWRLSTARGGTGGRPFIVGDLPEFIESESNSTLAQAEIVSLPLTINGQIEGERDLDYFQFEAREGQVVTADIVSRRLGSPLEPVAEFYDHLGNVMAASVYRIGSDSVLALRVPKTGLYRFMLGHLGFQGGPQYVYRATLSTLSYIPVVYPPGGQAGAKGRFSLYALTGNLATGEPQLRPASNELDLPAGYRGEWTLRNHLFQGHLYQGDVPHGNAIAIEIGDLPAVVEDAAEQGSNDTRELAQVLTEPCQVFGRFLAAGDEDWFRFQATKGSLWTIECQRYPTGSDCLPIVTLTNSDGAPLAAANMADDPRQPCRLEWPSPSDGSYCLKLRDVQHGIRGGLDFNYRLLLRPAQAGFELQLSTDFANVVQGAKSEIEVKARRTGQCNGAIDLQIEGLPEGVRCESTQIAAGQNSVKLVLIADDKARANDVKLKIRGSTTHEGATLQSVALAPHLGRDGDGVSMGEPMVDHIQLTVRHKPVLRLYCSEAYQYAYRGTVYPYAMEVERLNGFDGPIHIEVADRQIKDLDGIVVHDTLVQSGQTQFMLPVYLPETMHINVQAHSNVYAQAYVVFDDAWGQKQSQLFVSEMRCMIRPLPTVAKLSAVEPDVRGGLGETIDCRLKLERTSLFSGAMKVEMVQPTTVSGQTVSGQTVSGLIAPAITIESGQSEATVQVLLPDKRALSDTPIKFRAVGELPGYASVVSEAVFRLNASPQRTR